MFYRKHKRVVFDGSHPDTGEFLPSMTKQSFKAECDINNIIKSFSQTGMINHISQRRAQYVDLPDSVDFQEAIATVELARTAFMTLPSKVRDRFQNDPEQFLAFLHDPKNEDEARALGLLNPKPAPPPGAPGTPPNSSESDPPAPSKS